VHRETYQKQKFVKRLAWTVRSNLALLASALGAMRRADAILSPAAAVDAPFHRAR